MKYVDATLIPEALGSTQDHLTLLGHDAELMPASVSSPRVWIATCACGRDLFINADGSDPLGTLLDNQCDR